jgi:spermidine synthase
MVATLQLTDLRRTGSVVGRLSGIGTLGAITSTFLTGFVLVPALPTSVILLGTGGLLVATGLGLAWYRRGLRGSLRRALRTGEGRALLLALPLVPLLTAVAPTPCQRETAYHCVRVDQDPARPAGRVLWMDTLRHSYVDLADPTFLEFGYVRAMASVLDAAVPAGRPVDGVFVGGGGLTLPRYLAATRPGSRATVLEIDPGVIEVGRERLGVNAVPGLRVRVGDGRTGLAALPDRSAGLVVGDAFGGLIVPWHLATREAAEQVDRVLADGGLYLMNVIDYPPDLLARSELVTLRQVFPHVALLATPATLALGPNGGGNHVLVASRSPLPLDRTAARLAEREPGWTVADEATTARFAGPLRGLTDDFAPADQLLGR